MEGLETIITQHPFWKGMESEHFPLLVDGAALVQLPAGLLLAREDQEADRFYLILRGEIALEATLHGQGPVKIQVIGPGEALGWSWLFPPYRWHFNARVVQETEAIVWDTGQLRAKATANPKFGYDLACRMTRVLLQRLQATHMQLVDFYGPPG